MMIVLFLAATFVANALGSCPAGWSHYEPDNTCIRYFNTQYDFAQARKRCQLEHGDLVTIKNDQETNFVLGLVGGAEKFWHGVWDDNKDGTFTTVTGYMASYLPWNAGEPNGGTRESCAMAYGSGSAKGKWNDAKCSLTIGFVCERAAGFCAKGWVFYPPEKTCMKVFGTLETFSDAQKTCGASMGDLAKIASDDQKNFVLGLAGNVERLWFGVWDDNKDSTFTSVDGSALTYTAWNSGEPNGGTRELCAMLYGTGNAKGKWNDAPCSLQMQFVCETDSARCPKGWKHYEGDHTCVQFYNTEKTFDSARETCQASQGDLVQIHNNDQRQFINAMVGNVERYWIGIWDNDQDNKFTYLDGSPLVYTKWMIGEPNGAYEHCTMAYGEGIKRGMWNDAKCSMPMPFVCSTNALSCRKGWTYYLKDKSCVKMFETPKSFGDARKICQASNADLMQMRNNDQKQFVDWILAQLKENVEKYWVGAWDEDKDGTFKYIDGSGLGGVPWNSGEPNGRGQVTCAMIYGSGHLIGRWNDGDCNLNLKFLCESKS